MKRILMFLSLLALMLSAGAGNQNMFSYDRSAIEQELATLNDLEQYVLANEGITLEALNVEGNPLAENITAAPFGTVKVQGGPLGIPSILWGFCFSIPGIIVVYLVTEDSEETRLALIGCVVSALLSGGTYWLHPW